MVEIKNEYNDKGGRFVIYELEQFAGELTYVWAGNIIIIDHTEVGDGFSGKGYATKLVMEAVAFARKHEVKIMPLCPYAKSVFDKDPNLVDVSI